MSSPEPNRYETRIFDAAARCFAEKGIQATTVVDVADSAGVSRPLVYKYFGDKEGLIDAVLRTTFDDWVALSERSSVGGREAQPSAAAALESRFEDAIEFVRERPIFRLILQRDPQVVTRGHLSELRRCRAASLESITEILRDGISSGEFREDLDVPVAAQSIDMMLFALLERALGLRPELELNSAQVQMTLELLLRGVRAGGRRRGAGRTRPRARRLRA